jgi:septin family protein
MLEGISSLVAVVPVIAKADTHTAPELEAYRREVIQVKNSQRVMGSGAVGRNAGS